MILFVSFSATAQNNAVSLDGNDDFIQTSFPGVLGNNARTFEAWINPDPLTGNACIIDYGLNAANSRNTFNVNASGGVGMITGVSNVGSSASDGSVVTGTWTHVAYTFDGTEGKIYVSGVLVNSANVPLINTPAGGTNLRIGERVPGGSINFDGLIDEVRIWDTARTELEIQATMNTELVGDEAGLVAYWNFNDATLSSVPSSLCTPGDDGTPQGGATIVAGAPIIVVDNCDTCIDAAQIDPNIICPGIFDPVIGCDCVQYNNSCLATFIGGVTEFAGNGGVAPWNIGDPCPFPLAINGCTDATACNFDPAATADDGSCLIIGAPCDDGDPTTSTDVITSNCVCAGVLASLSFSTSACNCAAGIDTDGDGLNDFAQITISIQPAFAGEGPYSISGNNLYDNTGTLLSNLGLESLFNGLDPLTGNAFDVNVYVPADNTTTYDLIISDLDNPASVFSLTNQGPCIACSSNPIPTASEWGLLCLAILLMSGLTISLGFQTKPTAQARRV